MMEASTHQLEMGRNITCAGLIAQDESLVADGRRMMATAVAHAQSALSSDEDGDRLLHFKSEPTAKTAWPRPGEQTPLTGPWTR